MTERFALLGVLIMLALAWPVRRWRRRRARREVCQEMALIEALIKVPHPLFRGHDDGLRLRTQARREAAGRIRVRANSVDSGAKVADVLKVVRGGR